MALCLAMRGASAGGRARRGAVRREGRPSRAREQDAGEMTPQAPRFAGARRTAQMRPYDDHTLINKPG
jgi:hypothetical protein